jgi:hypothetical protein
MKKSAWAVYEKSDGHSWLIGTAICSEDKIKAYCKRRTEDSQTEAYCSDDDDDYDEPFPYVSQFYYKPTEILELKG